jgi:hypothetical protein
MTAPFAAATAGCLGFWLRLLVGFISAACVSRVSFLSCGVEAVMTARAPFAAATAGRLGFWLRLLVNITSAVPAADSFHLGRRQRTCVPLVLQRVPQGLSLDSLRQRPAGRAQGNGDIISERPVFRSRSSARRAANVSHATSSNTLGFLSAIARSVRAAPDGALRPCPCWSHRGHARLGWLPRVWAGACRDRQRGDARHEAGDELKPREVLARPGSQRHSGQAAQRQAALTTPGVDASRRAAIGRCG